MSSGAWCEEALPGTALGGIAMSILTSYSGNGWPKFSEKTGFLRALRMEAPDNCDAETIANLLRKGWLCQIATVRYLVKGRARGKESALLLAIEQGTIIRHSGFVIARVLFHCEQEVAQRIYAS
jgi:hypothetical protein